MGSETGSILCLRGHTFGWLRAILCRKKSPTDALAGVIGLPFENLDRIQIWAREFVLLNAIVGLLREPFDPSYRSRMNLRVTL